MNQSGIDIRIPKASDNKALCELMASTPMGSSIKIAMDRSPDFFAGAKVQTQFPKLYGAFETDTNRCVGLFSAGSRCVYVDGQQSNIRYLSDLRIHSDYQRGRLLAKGFRILRNEVFQKGEYAQTLVLEDNKKALSLLESGRAGLPHYQRAGRYASILLTPQKVSLKGDKIATRRAKHADIERMQKLAECEGPKRQFYPPFNFKEIGSDPTWQGIEIQDFLIAERKNELLGFIGIWNQSEYKRIRINHLSNPIRAIRPLWNVFARRFNYVALPKIGATLPTRYITAATIKDWDHHVLRSLLHKALNREKNDNTLYLLGLDQADPLIESLKGLRKRIDYGRHYLVSFSYPIQGTNNLPFYFDPARI